MDDKFLAALRKINTDNPQASVESIHRIFTRINTMSQSEVIAAFQTFRFFLGKKVSDDKVTEERVGHIKNALETRMRYLCTVAPKEQQKSLALTFSYAMGTSSHYWMFKRIVGSDEQRPMR